MHESLTELVFQTQSSNSSKPTLKIDEGFEKSFQCVRIGKAASKSLGNQQRTKKESDEMNNRLTVQMWRSSERAGALLLTVTLPTRDAAKFKMH